MKQTMLIWYNKKTEKSCWVSLKKLFSAESFNSNSCYTTYSSYLLIACQGTLWNKLLECAAAAHSTAGFFSKTVLTQLWSCVVNTLYLHCLAKGVFSPVTPLWWVFCPLSVPHYHVVNLVCSCIVIRYQDKFCFLYWNTLHANCS